MMYRNFVSNYLVCAHLLFHLYLIFKQSLYFQQFNLFSLIFFSKRKEIYILVCKIGSIYVCIEIYALLTFSKDCYLRSNCSKVEDIVQNKFYKLSKSFTENYQEGVFNSFRCTFSTFK